MTISSLGRYQIVSELGRGSTCTVHRALDPVLERSVAIKILNEDLPEESLAELKARFVREAKAAGKLNHPNLVTIYDVDMAGDVAYISMEYIEGQSIRQLLDSGAPTPFDFIADVVAQIADGLDYAERAGVVHRDVKPANIMILPTGQAKLTDFGVARIEASSLTQTGAALGSPKYMSPEQVRGQHVDGRADIFSLGVVLYEMLTRKTPFERPDTTLFVLMQSIVNDPVPRVSELDREIPAGFDVILERALAKRREDRYARASEFARDLRNYTSLAPTGTAETPAPKPTQATPGTLIQFGPSQELTETVQSPAAAQKAQTEALNARLRHVFDYLQALVRQFNNARPALTVKLELVPVGGQPTATLGNGIVECHTKRIGDMEVVDYIALTYRMSSADKIRLNVSTDDAWILKEQLERARIEFNHNVVKNAADSSRSEVFSIDPVIPATAILRGDYGAHALEIQCQNIGMLGPAIYRFSVAEITDKIVREFGNLVLVMPSELARFRQPG